MNAPLVSIGIVAYNQEKFITEAIQGAINQDYRPLEIIVADDCSTDRTPEIIREFSMRYPDIIFPVIGQQNLGVTGNSNRALAMCHGKYINIFGGDDILLPNKISRQVEWMEENENRVFCGHACEIFYDDAKVASRIVHPLHISGSGAKNIILHGPPYFALSVLFRKSALPPYGFDERVLIVSDFMLWVDLAGTRGLWGIVDGVHAKYRRHVEGLSHISRIEALLSDTERAINIGTANYGFQDCRKRSIMNLVTIPRLVARLKKRDFFRFFMGTTLALICHPIIFLISFGHMLKERLKNFV
ncbi:glycosyltransferase family 2 protein [Ferrovum myxofaciens]|uniref:glycosyltransferase family 2 protein n=1 Tax=Ferrovum myxofaciens TaxID=416213 RepID=UPI003EBE54E0